MSNKRRADRKNKPTVRWVEGGHHRSRTFDRAADANSFETEIKRRKQLGPLAASVLQSEFTLSRFVTEDWLPRYAVPNLTESTLRRYKEVWGIHIKPQLGEYELGQLTPQLLEDYLEDLRHAKVPLPTRRKAITIISGILRRASVRGLISVNPVAIIAKPKAPIIDLADPLAPVTVEAIRAKLGRFDRIVLDLLAYQGLRPNEVYKADWRQVGDRTIRVYASKTSKARVVTLLDPVVESLKEWRLASGRPKTGLILPRTSPWLTAHRRQVAHEEWTRWDWQNWSGRIYRNAAEEVGVKGDMRAYRLRCSFVSLLLWEGKDLTYAADQAGHSIATLSTYYAGVIKELADQPRCSAAEAIGQARTSVGAMHSLVAQPWRKSEW